MRFLPKKHFKWREPKPFLKLNDAFECSKLRWWHKPLVALVGVGMLLLTWYLGRLNPDKQPLAFTNALLIALAGGAFFAYGIPWLNSLSHSEVCFFDRHLIRIRGNSYLQIKYCNIASFSWRVSDDFSTLILKHRGNGRNILLGVPPAISMDAVSQFLLDHHVQFERSV